MYLYISTISLILLVFLRAILAWVADHYLNVVGAQFPQEDRDGKIKGQRNSGVAVWTAFGVQIDLCTITTTVFLAGRWFGNPWLPVVLFVGLTVAALGGSVPRIRNDGVPGAGLAAAVFALANRDN